MATIITCDLCDERIKTKRVYRLDLRIKENPNEGYKHELDHQTEDVCEACTKRLGQLIQSIKERDRPA